MVILYEVECEVLEKEKKKYLKDNDWTNTIIISKIAKIHTRTNKWEKKPLILENYLKQLSFQIFKIIIKNIGNLEWTCT